MFGAIVSLAGLGLSAFSSYKSGQAAEAAAEYNADLMELRAKQQRRTMVTNLRRQRDDKSRYMAGLNVHQAASGVLTDTGTPVLIREEIGKRLDEKISDYTNQALASESYTRSQAVMARFGGEQSAAAAKLQVGGTILGAIGGTASSYASYADRRKPS